MNRKEWEAHFDQQAQSNLSMQEYCEEHELKYSNFTAAKSRYRVTSKSSSFISVVTPPATKSQSTASIQITCGKALATIDNCTPQWLAEFMREVV